MRLFNSFVAAQNYIDQNIPDGMDRDDFEIVPAGASFKIVVYVPEHEADARRKHLTEAGFRMRIAREQR